MQEDMHFYGVYALARATGIRPEVARKIAYASQFVDDSIEDEAIVLADHRAVVPTMTSHKPIDYQNTLPGDQWKVWVPFHFLPGNRRGARSFVEKMVCLKNSSPAQKMLEHALRHKTEPFGPHLAGITAHVYADTFAHYGFVGLARDWNRVNNDSIEAEVRSESILKYIEEKLEVFRARLVGSLAEAIPVGHGAVATYPDRPYLKWRYAYETGKVVERNNPRDYMEACKSLHDFFLGFVKDNKGHAPPVSYPEWGQIKKRIRRILIKEASKEERIVSWKEAISSGDLFPATDQDRAISYSDKEWKSARITYHFAEKGTLEDCDGCLFIRAAWRHRNYVLHELLPQVGVIVY